MALGHQLGDGALVQGPSDEQNDVVDHVAVPAGTQDKACHRWAAASLTSPDPPCLDTESQVRATAQLHPFGISH